MSAKLEEGVEICIDGTSISYDKENDEYEIEIKDSSIMCLDLKSKLIRIKLHSNKIKLINDNNITMETQNTKQNIDDDVSDEPSDETDQEQEEEDKHENNQNILKTPNIINDLHNDNDDKKEENIQKKQDNIIDNAIMDNIHLNNHSNNHNNNNNDPFIPKDQQEIIELSNDDNDEVGCLTDEDSKKQDHLYDDIIIPQNNQINMETNMDTNMEAVEANIDATQPKSIQTKNIIVDMTDNDSKHENMTQHQIEIQENINIDVVETNIEANTDTTEDKSMQTNNNNVDITANDSNHEQIVQHQIEIQEDIMININHDKMDDSDIMNGNKSNNQSNIEQNTIVTQTEIVSMENNTNHNNNNHNISDITLQNEPGNECKQNDEIIDSIINVEPLPLQNEEIKMFEIGNDNINENINLEGHSAQPQPPPLQNDNTPSHSQANIANGIDEYASSDDDQHETENERSIKIEHNLRDPYLDELLTKQINAALQIESEDEPKNAEEYVNSNEEEGIKNLMASRNNWRWALKPDNIAIEWRKYAPTIDLSNLSTITKSLSKITANTITTAFYKNVDCILSIDECDCVQRLIFIMKYYSFWMKFKIETCDNKLNNHNHNDIHINEYYDSVTQLIDSLKAYNQSKLLRDYLHIRHYHFNDDKLIAYIHRSQIPDCNDKNKMCKCITRNHQNKEIYKNVNSMLRKQLYWIANDNNNIERIAHEMVEINLQKLLDVIHSSFLHNAISNGTKFITKINIGQEQQLINAANNMKEKRRVSKPIIDAPNYEFGIKFDFHHRTKQSKYYCAPKYPNLKAELLNNTIHALDINDYQCIYNKAQAYILCDEGCKNMISKRSMYNIAKGSKINIQNVIVILTRCNYSEIERKFNMNSWMKKHKKDNDIRILKNKNSEIANWNKILIESIKLFGDLLDELQYIYHGINYKITFKDLSGIQFNIPISCTTQYSVARNFATEFIDGICLKLGKMSLTKDINHMFDISDFSDYPNEREVILFGGKLSFVDIIYDSLSHHNYVLSLKLYQKIIKGRWFTTNNDYHNKKHQRRIVKMIENMIEQKNNMNQIENENNANGNGMVKIDLDLGLNYIDPYIQSLFECITVNVLKKTIWINKESDTLLPELKTIFVNEFIPFLKHKPFNIQSKYAHVDTWVIAKKYLLMTDRTNPLRSKPFDYVEILNNDMSDVSDMSDNCDMELDEHDHDHDEVKNENNNQNNKPILSLKQFKRLKSGSNNQNNPKNNNNKQPTDLKITFGFRCYKKYDMNKKQDMFKGEFTVIDLPNSIESVKMLGGLWFASIPLCKWDWCSFSSKKKSKGSSLFSLSQLNEEQQLKIKICYQVKEVIQKVSLP